MSPPTTPALQRLSVAEKLIYGFGQVSYGVRVQIAGIILLFYNQVMGLDAAAVSAAISMSLIIDAFWDPLFGHFSDSMRTRLGRRHPLMYASVIPVLIGWVMLFNPPQGLSSGMLGAYLLGTLLFLRLAMSSYEIPSRALIPELAPDYNDRTVLLSYRYLWETFGRAAAAFLSFGWFLRESAANPKGQLGFEGYSAMGWAVGALAMIAILVCAVGTHHKIKSLHIPPQRRINLKQAFRELGSSLYNWNLGVAVIAGLIAGISYGVTSGMYVYISTYFWQLPSSSIFQLVLVEVIAAPLAAFIAPWLSMRWGKKWACVGLFMASVVTNNGPILLRLLGLFPGTESELFMPLMLADRVVTGIFGTGGFIVVSSMIADITEESAVKTGRRSEGLLSTADGVLRNAVTGLGAIIPGVLLTAVAFPVGSAPADVPVDIVRKLAWYYLPLTSGMSTLSILVWLFYRIDKHQHEANLAKAREAVALRDSASEGGAEPVSPTATGGSG